MNDTRFDYASPSSNSAGTAPYGQDYPQHSYVSTSQYQQVDQQSYTQYSGTQTGFNSGLTKDQLYIHNYGQETTNGIDAWNEEDQRQGPWYGNVQ